jgi:hypothetical protein
MRGTASDQNALRPGDSVSESGKHRRAHLLMVCDHRNFILDLASTSVFA